MISVKFALFLGFVAVVLCETPPHHVVGILSQESEILPSGKFHYSYESEDGSKASQDGELKTIDKEAGESVHGSFEYKGDDGHAYKLSYVADENGFQPEGEHVPTVPPLIARALQYLATAPPLKEDKV